MIRRPAIQILTLAMLSLCALVTSVGVAAHPATTGGNEPSVAVRLLAGLGNHQHRIATRVPAAQRYFNQGLQLYYGFNHDEAARAFREAARLDPDCAMAQWGIALCLGPNYNLPTDKDRALAAYQAIQKARALSSAANELEREYSEALSQRYSDSPDADRPKLDQAYASAMRKLAERYPDDLDAQTLFAESLMVLRPWDLWTAAGEPQPGTDEIIATIERVLAINPNHPGAIHLYIHAVEASTQPSRALTAADRLAGLMPAAGHMVHMPSHIYFRIGRYQDAVESNRRAITADQAYFKLCQPTGVYRMLYYPHNIHFLWSAACYSGQSRAALDAAAELAKELPVAAVREMPMLEGFLPTETFTLVQFGKWDEILQLPSPPDDLTYTRGIWHFARGRALAAHGKYAEADSESKALHAIRDATDDGQMLMRHSARKLLSIAAGVLAGDLATRQGNLEQGIAHLEQAITLEDTLAYDEPPAWYAPVRQKLGTVYLAAGRPVAAEEVYRIDLQRHPDNGWSQFGLVQALRAQAKETEAAALDQQFNRAWSKADVKLTGSAF